MTYADKEQLGEEIAELAAHLDAAIHRLLTLIARFDESGGWADQGALTCAHWLCWRIGLELGAAREHVRVAKALPDLPQIDEALRVGRLSYSKARALTRVATGENEAELLAMAFASTASQLERICRGYRRALGNMGGQPPEDEADIRWLRSWETDGGFVRVDMQLRPDEAAIVTIHEDSRGNVVDVGRRRRNIPTMLRRALRLRDHGCRFPGCTNRLVDAHHVVHWAKGSATTLDNLCSLCRRHHTFVHEHGFRIDADGFGSWRFVRPDGREVTASGVPVGFFGEPIAALRARAQDDGIAIDATTNECRWDGRAVDYGLAVWTMMPRDGSMADTYRSSRGDSPDNHRSV